MKKLSFLPSVILVLTIITLGLTSCSRKYGCYYTQSPELKVQSQVGASKWTSPSAEELINECTTSNSAVSN
ncbi:MAG: hypothetical protein ABIQ11_11870 [Saprospiraceae bacterium]